jgi:hypothetical protein
MKIKGRDTSFVHRMNVNNEQISLTDYRLVGRSLLCQLLPIWQFLQLGLWSNNQVCVPHWVIQGLPNYFNFEYDNSLRLRLRVAGIRFYKRSPHTGMNSAKVDSFTINLGWSRAMKRKHLRPEGTSEAIIDHMFACHRFIKEYIKCIRYIEVVLMTRYTTTYTRFYTHAVWGHGTVIH